MSGISAEPIDMLCLVASTGGGGAERVAASLVNQWTADGKTVLVAAFARHPREFSINSQIVSLDSAHSTRAMVKIWRLFQRVWAVAVIIRRSRPCHVVSFTEGPNLVALFAAIISGSLGRLTISVHADPKFWSTEHRLLCRLLYPIAPRVVVCADGIRQHLIGRVRLRGERVRVIRNPLGRESSVEGEVVPALAALPYILGVGRLEYEKGFDLLLRAFAASGVSREYRLRIVGDGSQRLALKSLATDLGVSSSVEFHGWHNNLEEFYRRAAVLVVPSRTEAFGNVIIEAMSHGCPVIAFDCDYGPRELIIDTVNGYLVPAQDVGQMASRIREVVEQRSSEKLGLLIRNARSASKEFELSAIAPRWLSVDG